MNSDQPNTSGALILLVVGIGTLLTTISSSTVNLALPMISSQFGLDISLANLIVSSFLIVVTLLLLISGRAADLFGHRLVYLSGYLVFGAASVFCALASKFSSLLVGRIVQGVGSALVLASAPALLTTNIPPQRRGQALGVLSSATYIGLTIGPPLSGFLIGVFDWPAIFWLNVPVSILVIVGGYLFLPNAGAPANPQRRGRQLLVIDFSLLADPVFRGAAVSAVLNYLGLFIPVILLPFALHEGLSLGPGPTGMVMMAQPILMAICAPIAGWLSDRWGSRGLAVAGMVIMAGGLAGMGWTLGANPSPASVAIFFAVTGMGTGVFITPNSNALFGAAPRGQQGMASGFLGFGRNLGMLSGVGLATLFFKFFGGRTGHAWGASDFAAARDSFYIAAISAILAALSSYRALRNEREQGGD